MQSNALVRSKRARALFLYSQKHPNSFPQHAEQQPPLIDPSLIQTELIQTTKVIISLREGTHAPGSTGTGDPHPGRD